MTILHEKCITFLQKLTYAHQVLLYGWDKVDIGDVAMIAILQLDWDVAFTFEWNFLCISKGD
jgi:hypothetical protein